MGRFNLNFVVFVAMMVATMQFRGSVAQTSYVVGDILGWTIPPGGAGSYTKWASHQTFTVGDMLVFNFINGLHDVAEVSEAAYGPCTTTNPISQATTGPVTITLTTPGSHYYICTITSHCQIGQKLTINVSDAATDGPPSPSHTPSSPPTIAPTPPMVAPPTTMASAPYPPTSSPNTMPPAIATAPSSSSPFPIDSSTPPPPASGTTSFTAMGYATFLTFSLAFLNY